MVFNFLFLCKWYHFVCNYYFCFFFFFVGDEEERRSFRSKGIPVIFQDELDEKPEMGNKSPVILKDEKPPLLPPSYNSTNPDGK